ncbi:hypothetical protein JYT72_00795 [Crocinitomix catalasitica]|nr:hypothetical protein [Crocinitomix catalasitica]
MVQNERYSNVIAMDELSKNHDSQYFLPGMQGFCPLLNFYVRSFLQNI